MPSADFCSAVRRPLDRLSRLLGDTEQISRGKLNRLRCTTAGSTLRALDGYGLRDTLPARPALAPRIRFLFIGSHLCSTLPSDPASRRQPLRFANPSPPSGWVEDFHLRAIEHARHTTNRPEAGRSHRHRPLLQAAPAPLPALDQHRLQNAAAIVERDATAPELGTLFELSPSVSSTCSTGMPRRSATSRR